MKALSLFSGIGLHDLGLERAGWEIAGQVENDPWCSAVLARHWPGVPRWGDMRDVTAESIGARAGVIDLVTGGSPCQDISLAGRGAGLGGPKSSLWKHMLRIVRDLAPLWVLLENVPALRTRGAVEVVSDLEEIGYTVLPPVVVGAWAAGAPHRRNRVWIVARLADTDRHGWGRRSTASGRKEGQVASGSERPKSHGRRVGDATSERDGEHDDARHALADHGRPAHQEGRVFGGAGGRGVGHAPDLGRGQGQGRAPEPGEPAAGRAVSRGAARAGVADAGRNGVRQLEQREPTGRAPGSLRDGGEAEPGGLRAGGMADAHGLGREQLGGGGILDIERPASGHDPDRRDGWPAWPAGRGEPQHPWEPPRLTQSRMGGEPHGRASRLDSFARRNRLRALGNANPPDVPELIGRWILAQNPPD